MKAAMKWLCAWAAIAALGVAAAMAFVQAWDAEWEQREAKMRERGIIEPWEKPAGFFDTVRRR